MEPTSSLWIFFALTFGVIVLPGLDMAFVTSSALTAGLRGGATAVAGIVAGGLVHVLVNVSGVSALLLVWPRAFNMMLLCGSAYMAWIGWGILRSALTDAAHSAAPTAVSATRRTDTASPSPATVRPIFIKAALNCLLNPKAYAFMLAVFPAFLHTAERSLVKQAALLATIIAGNQIAVYGATVLATVAARRLSGPGVVTQRRISLAVGVTLILAAAFTLATAWRPRLT